MMYIDRLHRRSVRNRLKATALFCSVVLFCNTVYAQIHDHNASTVLDRDAALALSQSAIGNMIGDHRFVNQDGKPVNLYNFRGKPLVVNFIYTSCYHICPVMTVHLKKVVEIAREALGRDSFNVVTIGFDPGVDTPERMRSFAVERGVDFGGWAFLSGDVDTIKAVSADTGFSFAPSPKGFDHLAQTTIVDATGKVYRQVYGADFDTQALVEPLKELVFEKPASGGSIDRWIKGVRLFCTIYDPTTGRYQFDYSIFVMIIVGVLCLGSILVFIIKSWRQKT